jgi:hypothetical protein
MVAVYSYVCRYCCGVIVASGRLSRCALLPSEYALSLQCTTRAFTLGLRRYWIELSDEWLCHPGPGQTLPTVDIQGLPGQWVVVLQPCPACHPTASRVAGASWARRISYSIAVI